MRKILVLIMALTLAGCGSSSNYVDDEHIKFDEKLCETNGGLKFIRYATRETKAATNTMERTVLVDCKNGARFDKKWEAPK
jgi:hypothetical protein